MAIQGERSTVLGSDEVRPEELSALLDRLQTGHDRMTVRDVAETLGLSESDVERALVSIRTRAAAVPSAISPQRKHRKRRLLLWGSATMVAGMIGFGLYNEGMSYGAHKQRLVDERGQATLQTGSATLATNAPMSEVPVDIDSLVRRLVDSMPRDMSLRIGGSIYQGESTSDIFPQAEILDGVLRLARSQTPRASTVGRTDRTAILRELQSRTPVAVSGITFQRISVARGNTGFVVYLPIGPGPAISLGSNTDGSISRAIRTAEDRLSTSLVDIGRPDAP